MDEIEREKLKKEFRNFWNLSINTMAQTDTLKELLKRAMYKFLLRCTDEELREENK